MKMFVKKCVIAFVGVVFTMNLYAAGSAISHLSTKIAGKTVKKLFQSGAKEAMQQYAKFHVPPAIMLQDLGGAYKMGISDVLIKLQDDSEIGPLLTKKA